MTCGRLVSLAGMLGVVLALASPFGATPVSAGGLNVTIDSPAAGATLSSPTVTISGTVKPDFLAEVHEVRFELLRGSTAVDRGSTPSADFSFTSTVGANGRHTVKVTARGKGVVNLLDVDGSAEHSFSVAVPPDPPTGLTATLMEDRRVALRWTSVAHPDLRGYAIYRKLTGAGFALLDGTLPGRTSYIDQTPGPGGVVQYHVVSLRDGATASDDPEQWLRSSPSTAATVTVPVPPPGPADSTTTLPPREGTEPGASSGVSLGDVFSARPAAVAMPQPSPRPTLPDTGFSQTLPFSAPELGGQTAGRPATVSTGGGDLSAGSESGSSTDRRALLVPVAAGSVLCVAALHLRWLNRRLATLPPTGGGDGLAGNLAQEVDLELFDVERLPVPAGK